ncbi:MAG TPA: hypothetical protein VNO30_18435 [Kofleriaceae bacterium]|nr:hypothetical protein [Kofleriaceae bacterium]
MWIAAAAIERDLGPIARERPALWRDIRRFNAPVKLALAAVDRVVPALARPAEATLVALAPCRPGSPELRKISRDLDAAFADPDHAGPLRVNPIYTLHAIDNLGLSALAITLGNRAPAVCFGGAAGQAWTALEHARDALADGATEVVVLGGDPGDAASPGSVELGVALVLSSRPAATSRVQVQAIERDRAREPVPAVPHAAAGLARWIDALAAAPPGRFSYPVPAADGDGVDRITIVAELL